MAQYNNVLCESEEVPGVIPISDIPFLRIPIRVVSHQPLASHVVGSLRGLSTKPSHSALLPD